MYQKYYCVFAIFSIQENISVIIGVVAEEGSDIVIQILESYSATLKTPKYTCLGNFIEYL